MAWSTLTETGIVMIRIQVFGSLKRVLLLLSDSQVLEITAGKNEGKYMDKTDLV